MENDCSHAPSAQWPRGVCSGRSHLYSGRVWWCHLFEQRGEVAVYINFCHRIVIQIMFLVVKCMQDLTIGFNSLLFSKKETCSLVFGQSLNPRMHNNSHCLKRYCLWCLKMLNECVCVRYDPECNTWSMDVPSLSLPRSRVCVIEMDGCLITLGGFDGMTCINTVERSKHTCTLLRNGCLEMWSSNTCTLVFCGVGMTRWRTPGLSWHQCWGAGHLHQPLSWTVRFTLWEEQMETCRWIQVHKHTYVFRFKIL